MTNLLYALTDHDHTENELTPWLAECVWGHWEYAAGSPHPPIRQPGIPEGGGRVPMAVERLNPRRTVRP